MTRLIKFSFSGFGCVRGMQELFFPENDMRSAFCAVLGLDGSIRDVFADALCAMKYIVSHPSTDIHALKTSLAGKTDEKHGCSWFMARFRCPDGDLYEYEISVSDICILSETLCTILNGRSNVLYRRELTGNIYKVTFGSKYRGPRKRVCKYAGNSETLISLSAMHGSKPCQDVLMFFSDCLVITPDIGGRREYDFVRTIAEEYSEAKAIALSLMHNLDVGNVSRIECRDNDIVFVRKHGFSETATMFEDECATIRRLFVLGVYFSVASCTQSVVLIRNYSVLLSKAHISLASSFLRRYCHGKSQAIFTDCSSYVVRCGIVHPSACCIAAKDTGCFPHYKNMLDGWKGRKIIGKICGLYDVSDIFTFPK